MGLLGDGAHCPEEGDDEGFADSSLLTGSSRASKHHSRHSRRGHLIRFGSQNQRINMLRGGSAVPRTENQIVCVTEVLVGNNASYFVAGVVLEGCIREGDTTVFQNRRMSAYSIIW